MKNKLSTTERGYIAGIIDGEGYFGLLNNHHEYPRPCLKIGNTNHNVIIWLKTKVGGSITGQKRKNGRSVYYELCLSSNFIRSLLPQIQNILIIKKTEAEIINEALIANKNQNRPSNIRYQMLKELQKKLMNMHSGHADYFRRGVAEGN
jgi:hypothetical protein